MSPEEKLFRTKCAMADFTIEIGRSRAISVHCDLPKTGYGYECIVGYTYDWKGALDFIDRHRILEGLNVPWKVGKGSCV